MTAQSSIKAFDTLREFLKLESAGGLLLIGATVIALVIANIPATLSLYKWILKLQVTVSILAVLLIASRQIGVMLMVFLARVLKLAEFPEGTNWGQIYGVAILCGVGFTMSLFIGRLAFEHCNC